MNHPKPLNNRLDFLKDERPQKPPPTASFTRLLIIRDLKKDLCPKIYPSFNSYKTST